MKKNILILGDPCTGKSYLTNFIKGKNVVKVCGRIFNNFTFKGDFGISKETEVIIIDDTFNVESLNMLTEANIEICTKGKESFTISPTIIATSNIDINKIPSYIKDKLFIFQAV